MTSLVFISLFTSIQHPPLLLCVVQNLLTNLNLFISTKVNWSSSNQCSLRHSASIPCKLEFGSTVNSLGLFHEWCRIVNLLSFKFDLLADSYNILNRWKNSQLLNVHNVSDVG
jgi:hypothetical protein